MEIKEELKAIYNRMFNDPEIQPHQIVHFRNFLNQSFKLSLQAGHRPVVSSLVSDSGEGIVPRFWDGKRLDRGEKKNIVQTLPVQRVSVVEEDINEVIEKSLIENNDAKLYHHDDVKHIEDQIKKRGGKFAKNAPLEAKKRILAKLQAEQD